MPTNAHTTTGERLPAAAKRKLVSLVDRATELLEAQIEYLKEDGWLPHGQRYVIEGYPAQAMIKTT